jgi:uncharacterized protein
MKYIISLITILLLLTVGCSESSEYIIETQDSTSQISVSTPKQLDFQKISLETEDGVKIIANYYAQSKMSPSVILLHQLGKDKSTYKSLSKKLFDKGFNVISLDLRGHGESDGQLTDFSNEDFRAMVKDVNTAHKMLTASENANNEISIVGASIGANTALTFATQNSIYKVVLLSPGTEYRGINIADIDYQKPLLVVSSKEDIYSYESSQTLNGIFIELEGSSHGTDMFKDTTLEEDITEWLSN